jgi:hypothetical protein
MSCCGSRRSIERATSSSGGAGRAQTWVQGPVEFQYAGTGRLTVVGPLTGTQYQFTGSGARVSVHGADAPSLVGVPGLVVVR